MPPRHNFLRLVKERLDINLTCKHVCPFCGSGDVQSKGMAQTLVAGPYNHFQSECVCGSCDAHFEHHWQEQGKHWKTGKVQRVHWYINSITRKVLAGIPACCGGYTWTCKHCDGDVTVERFRHEGVLSGKWASLLYWYRFTCQSCGRTVNSMYEDWSLPRKPGPKPPSTPPGQKPGFMVWEGVGVGVFNPRGLKSLTLETE